MENPKIGRAPKVMYSILCARINARGEAQMCLRKFAGEQGVEVRTVQRWRVELERHGLIKQISRDGKSRQTFEVNRAPEDIRAAKFDNVGTIVRRAEIKTIYKVRTQIVAKNQRQNATGMSHPRCDIPVANKQENKTTTPLTPHEPGEQRAAGRLSNQNGLQSMEGAAKGRAPGTWNSTKSEVGLLARTWQCSMAKAWEKILNFSDSERMDLMRGLWRLKSESKP